MQNRKNKIKGVLLLSVLLAIVVFSIVPLVRTLKHDSLYPGQEAYYHERISKYIYETGIPSQDPLMPRPYILEPYHLLLSLSMPLLGVYNTLILIPFLLGIFSVILSYLILTQFKLDNLKKLAILLIFITSPISVYLFSTSSSYALPMFLFLLGFYLFIRYRWISFPVLALISFFNPFFSLASIFILLSYSLNRKSYLKKSYIASSIIMIISLIYHLPFYLKYGFPNIHDFANTNMIINTISDLGANIGFGIFHLLLFFLGLFIIWRIKKQIIPYTFLLILIIISAYYTPLNIYLNLILSVLVGYGLLAFAEKRWKIGILKIFTILILICGLLFSSISYMDRTAAQPPDKEVIKSLEWFEGQPQGIVLSYYSNGYWIGSIAKKPALLDSNTFYLENADIKFNESLAMFMSRNLETTRSLLHKNNISYIWITKDMKQGQVWTEEDQGLLFLLRNNETFKNIYASKHSEIWKIR